MTTNEQIAALASQAGISLRMVEATIGHSLTKEERDIFLKAKTVAQLKRNQKKARGPMSSAERVRKHNAKLNELGEIPAIENMGRRESCRYDLELFGWTYCRELLRHRASADLKEGLIVPAQNAILGGGKIGAECGRGIGKTTWLSDIAPLWALCYGHRRFVTLIAASGRLAKKNLKSLKRLILSSPLLLADFPALTVPLREIGGIAQRAASQTYHGEPTECEWGSDQIRFPVLRDESGALLDVGCGGVLAVVGIGGAVRGANEGGQRPDYVILDDPQTKKIAESPSLVQKTLDYIAHDALMLAGHDRVIAAFVTITPQRFGDVAYELASDRHPEWEFRVLPFIKSFPPKWDSLVQDFCALYYEDLQRRDQTHALSREWYRAHQSEFAGTKVVDEEQFDPENEIDAIHHLLNLRAGAGERAFMAEIQMVVADINTQINVNTDTVCAATNGFPRLVMPPGVNKGLVAFSDVNIQAGKGMSWVVVAFGAKRTAAVVAYGRYPEVGPLVPPNSSEATKIEKMVEGMRVVAKTIAALDIRDQKGNRRVPIVLGFDRGYEAPVVMRAALNLQEKVPLPFRIVTTKGVGDNYRPRRDEVVLAADHAWGSRTDLGEYISVVSPYWREKMQASFLETPLMPGSLSLFGRDGALHALFANEVCANRLMRRYFDKQGRVRWDWARVAEDDHYGDALTQAFALASYYRLYAALPSVVDDKIRPEAHADDLFDPNRNTAIVDNSGRFEEEAKEIPSESVARDESAAPKVVYKFKSAAKIKKSARIARFKR